MKFVNPYESCHFRKEAFLLICFWVFLHVNASSQTDIHQLPVQNQFFARDLKTSSAIVTLKGFPENASLYLRYRDHQLAKTMNIQAGHQTFGFTDTLQSELSHYRIEFQDNAGHILYAADSLLVGDCFLMNGQSNAEARKKDSTSYPDRSPYIKAYGSGNENGYTKKWYVADGDGNRYSDGSIGQLALSFARQLVEKTGIPVCIINAAHGSQMIQFFQPNAQDGTGMMSNYGRTLSRLTDAGLQPYLRGIIWYQGEQDAASGVDQKSYEEQLYNLYNHWLQTYPSIEQVYLFQIRMGCKTPWNKIASIQKAQQAFADHFNDVEILSTNFADQYSDSCHFTYVNGYKRLATQLANVVIAKQYDMGHPNNFLPIRATQAKVYDHRWLSLKLDSQADQIEWDSEISGEFKLDTQIVHARNVWINGNFLNLEFDQPIDTFHTLSFTGHSGAAHPTVYHSGQAGMLSFYDLPIEQEATHDSVLLWQALAGGQTILFAHTSQSEWVNLSLYNASGVLIQKEERMMTPGKNELPDTYLPSGLYFLQVIRLGGETQMLKWLRP